MDASAIEPVRAEPELSATLPFDRASRAADDHQPLSRSVGRLSLFTSVTTTKLQESRSLSTPGMSAAFSAISSQLEHRRRESANLARTVEQHRSRLQAVERERDESYEKFGRVAQLVENAARSLTDGMTARQAGENDDDAEQLFELNARALDELESIATNLSVHLASCRVAWNDYVGSVETAKKLTAQQA